MRIALVATLVASFAVGCNLSIGTQFHTTWVRNESAMPVVLSVDDRPTSVVPAGASGVGYTGSKPAFGTSILTVDCHLLAETNSSDPSLLVIVHAGGGVTFHEGANLTALQPVGSVDQATTCF